MEVEIFTKVIVGIVTIISAYAATLFNIGNSQKIKAELLEKLDLAIEKKRKHSATELFRIIHGLRISYSDLEVLIESDNCSKIIYALKKTPGLVIYSNGKLEYTEIAKSKTYMIIDRIGNWLTVSVFGSFTAISFALFVFGKGGTSVAGFVFLVFSSLMLAIQVRQKKYDQMVSDIVHESNTISNTRHP